MNKNRRKRIDDLCVKLEDLKSAVQEIRDEEQEAFDNMPESFQSGERGEKMEEAISTLDDIETNLQDAIDLMEGIDQ